MENPPSAIQTGDFLGFSIARWLPKLITGIATGQFLGSVPTGEELHPTISHLFFQFYAKF